ncbi:DUF3108 domain-containing protein [Diaphorobacter sp. MNS-0]|uniref:DUF3108 domain-containing protein n=1 Tax=Diaphorobacter sp. MNS-0 TaxID=2866628 RepID=UPI001C736825|nr:DUF3108 domain-containing protein [Diaphorobacter sp. MNS-0]QYY26059.1 DUF3108 domain-containing protein [Diaphorobacter sp. MNS-0]
MPRRALLLLTAVVLALHWLVLVGLPRGGTDQGAPQRLAFHTRMVEPPPPPPPEPQAAPVPPPAPKPRPRPVRKPPPPPVEAPPPTQHPEPAPATEAPAQAAPSPAESPAEVPADSSTPPPEVPADAAAPSAPLSPASDPAMPAMAEASSASAPAAASQPAQEAPALTAGVEILPPGAAGAVAGTEPPPVRLPPSARLAFDVTGEVKKFHYNASAELLWRQDGTQYEARQQIKAFLLGARSQSSVGQITPQGLRPTRFGDKSRSERAAHFDFERGEVIFSANAPRAAIGSGAQDRLSVFIQLGALLAAAPERYPPGTRITLTTVGARSAERWTFTVEGPQTLELPAGSTPALKLQRLPRPDQRYDQKAELWLGTDMGYLPVRIRLTQANGDFADLSLSHHDTP